MNVNVLVLILVILIVLLGICIVFFNKKSKENMKSGKAVFDNPDYNLTCERDTECTPENNCFKGSYLRSQVYQNMCSPEGSTGLLRDKKKLRDNCLRSLGNPLNTQNLVCKVNIHDQRKCNWKK